MAEVKATRRYYPALSTIIDTKNIPESFGILKNGLEKLIGKTFFKDLLIYRTPTRDLANYEVFTGLQLYIGTTGKYFVADQVFVKFKMEDGFYEIDDIIIMETKLTDATKLSTRQGEAFTNKAGGFSARTKNPINEYKKVTKFNDAFKNINKEPTFIKCYDKAKGDEIDNFKLITNSNN